MNWDDRIQRWCTSPRPPADRCDLTFVREVGGELLVLVVDGAPGHAQLRPRWPRRQLFDAVADPWRRSDDPEALLRGIDDALRGRQDGRLSASAAAIRVSRRLDHVVLAEAGDTKVWRVGPTAVLRAEGVPRRNVAPEGALGTTRACVHTQTLPLLDCAGLAILTDGAHALLARPALPEGPAGWALTRDGQDDATVVLVLA